VNEPGENPGKKLMLFSRAQQEGRRDRAFPPKELNLGYENFPKRKSLPTAIPAREVEGLNRRSKVVDPLAWLYSRIGRQPSRTDKQAET
jgi:hypothetical protein